MLATETQSVNCLNSTQSYVFCLPNRRQQLRNVDALVHVAQVLDGRPHRCRCIADDFALHETNTEKITITNRISIITYNCALVFVVVPAYVRQYTRSQYTSPHKSIRTHIHTYMFRLSSETLSSNLLTLTPCATCCSPIKRRSVEARRRDETKRQQRRQRTKQTKPEPCGLHGLGLKSRKLCTITYNNWRQRNLPDACRTQRMHIYLTLSSADENCDEISLDRLLLISCKNNAQLST